MSSTSRDRVLAIIYALTIFVSAFLLFQVQPLVSKHILPWFGGTPAVWTTCMLFFQGALFAGYAYAHGSQQWLRPRQQALVHLGVLAAALVVALLGVLPDAAWKPTDSYQPVGKILLLLAATIGLPFFVLSTTGPLVQAWFSRSFPGRSPYRLYALSNVGSLLALLSYPVLFERLFDLPQQGTFWACGFVAFVLLCGYAAVRLRSNPPASAENATLAEVKPNGEAAANAVATPAASAAARPGFFSCLAWLLLPAFASVALLATTNHVCADVAVVPFLWIVPLALYLITFIIAFDQPFWYRPIATSLFTLIMIYGVGLVNDQGMGTVNLFDGKSFYWTRVTLEEWKLMEPSTTSKTLEISFTDFLTLNFAAMFGICMLCHGELVRLRPAPRYLTLFYLMIAAGGVLGGAAVTLVAPQVFTTYLEWELAVYFGCLIAVGVILRTFVSAAFSEAGLSIALRLALLASLGWIVLVPASIVLVDMLHFLQSSTDGVQLSVRNFFGTLTVREKDADDVHQAVMVLRHGAITHGSQFTEQTRRGQPTTYYATPTGVGRSLNYFRNTPPEGGINVGAIGLGTGTLAAYVGTGDKISFYEINPAVIAITEGGQWFTYLQDAKQRGATYEIKLGDARLTLERELEEKKPQRYHVLVVDAFSGDAIPAHLLTEEAFATYIAHLATPEAGGAHGALAVHISNRYLELDPIVRAAAGHFKMPAAQIENDSVTSEAVSSSTWIILTHNEALLEALRPHIEPPPDPLPDPILWTDKRSNLFDVLKGGSMFDFVKRLPLIRRFYQDEE